MSNFLTQIISILKKIKKKYREFYPGPVEFAWEAKKTHQWKKALTIWEEVIDRSPNNITACIQRGKILMKMGRFKDAETIFRQAEKRWPNSPQPLEGLAQNFHNNNEFEHACKKWKTLSFAFPEHMGYRADYIKSLLNTLNFEDAHLSYDNAAKKTQDPQFLSVLADIHAAEYDWAAAFKIMRSIRSSAPDNIKILQKEADIFLKAAMKTDSIEYFNQAIKRLKKIDKAFPWNLQIQIKLANLYIYLNRNDEANQIINKIPDIYDNHKKIMELKAWQCHHHHNVKGAKQIWDQLLKKHYIPVVHSPINPLKHLDKRTIRIQPHEILLFSTIHNEAWRMPWFLNYYRKIGVDHFFIIDNASNDNSMDYLIKQNDVHLFWTEDSFAKSNSGMRWIHELMDQFAQKNWCLYVDADEALIFPGVEKMGLRHLTRYLTRNNHEAVFAFMLDMHPYNNEPMENYKSDKRINDYYPYFENRYTFHGNTNCPYKTVTGGIRRRLFRISDFLTKTPVIRAGRNIKFLSSSHQTTPAVLSDVTAVLLHYKMIGNFHDNCIQAVYGETRTAGCQHRHLSWAKTSHELGKDYIYLNHRTLRYENSSQLVKLGLMRCPDTFFRSDNSNL